MSVFRCYSTDSEGHFRDVVLLDAESDLDALTQAKALPAAHAGFELWDGSRLVHRELVAAAAPLKPEDDRTEAPVGTRPKTLIKKLEQIAALIGQTRWGLRLLAVARLKDKRHPRS